MTIINKIPSYISGSCGPVTHYDYFYDIFMLQDCHPFCDINVWCRYLSSIVLVSTYGHAYFMINSILRQPGYEFRRIKGWLSQNFPRREAIFRRSIFSLLRAVCIVCPDIIDGMECTYEELLEEAVWFLGSPHHFTNRYSIG